MAVKYIFVTGGVVSSLGKGITAASLGRLLKSRGLKVSMQKLDPYLNVDPGTMNPYQHGEVFVTEDGAECDLDLGHYERFINEFLPGTASVTSGRVFKSVIDRERQGGYLGATVQIIPHITDEIKRAIRFTQQQNDTDVCIVEIGGTVGDIEGLPFLEAIRQLRYELGAGQSLLIHVTLVPYLRKAGELKTKPTQHSVKELGSLGLQPDMLVCRSELPLSKEVKAKIAMFCNMPECRVFQNADADSLYEVPLLLRQEGLDQTVCELLGFESLSCNLGDWERMVRREKTANQTLTIALVGKYIALPDAYLSVAEALAHAGIQAGVKVGIKWVQAEDVTKESAPGIFQDVSAIVVPGGFGARGLTGKREAIRYARENELPFLGLCLGMQMAVIEFARNVLGLQEADTTEVCPNTKDPVICLMPEQNLENLGGTMRLGAFPCELSEGTKARAAYGQSRVSERHRHRYEFNSAYTQRFEQHGMVFSGRNPQRDLAEIIEIPNHPFFVATQFHPEFKSRPDEPHPLFAAFVQAALTKTQSR